VTTLSQHSEPANAAQLRDMLEAATPTPVALVTGTPVTVSSWLVDTYGTRTGELVLTKSDGSRITRRVMVRHNGTSGADASGSPTVVPGPGNGTHADIASTAIDGTLSGTGTSQLVNLQVTAAANGASWTATFYPDFLRTA